MTSRRRDAGETAGGLSGGEPSVSEVDASSAASVEARSQSPAPVDAVAGPVVANRGAVPSEGNPPGP